MEKKPRLHLFEAFGIELEYMIVDRSTLNVKPIADELLRNEAGEVEGEMEKGETAWSNELVSHVIEIKSNGPTADLVRLRDKLKADIQEINQNLAKSNARLLSTAAHPWMDPSTETRLWEHESQEIYHAFDRIFGCKGHGWSNLQSMHINLPFYDDEEFARLHTAIRFMMPMLPALTASSPILGGKYTGYMDKRLYYYEKNQAKIPILTGKVIPEKLFTRHAYQKHVYDRIAAAIKPFDEDDILKPVWLNSRGAMARFDRGAIEIRIIDLQESVSADLAIAVLVTSLVKLLVKGKFVPFEVQESFETEELYQIFKSCVKDASKASIVDERYLKAWGFSSALTGGEFWKHTIAKVGESMSVDLDPWVDTLEKISSEGTLAERIVKALGNSFDQQQLHAVYSRLAECLAIDEVFVG